MVPMIIVADWVPHLTKEVPWSRWQAWDEAHHRHHHHHHHHTEIYSAPITKKIEVNACELRRICYLIGLYLFWWNKDMVIKLTNVKSIARRVFSTVFGTWQAQPRHERCWEVRCGWKLPHARTYVRICLLLLGGYHGSCFLFDVRRCRCGWIWLWGGDVWQWCVCVGLRACHIYTAAISSRTVISRVPTASSTAGSCSSWPTSGCRRCVPAVIRRRPKTSTSTTEVRGELVVLMYRYSWYSLSWPFQFKFTTCTKFGRAPLYATFRGHSEIASRSEGRRGYERDTVWHRTERKVTACGVVMSRTVLEVGQMSFCQTFWPIFKTVKIGEKRLHTY